jgi:uncharacterized sulfatase
MFANDENITDASLVQMIDRPGGGATNSLLLSTFLRLFETLPGSSFPRGYPGIIEDTILYLLEDAIDWTISTLNTVPQPFLGYIHYFPPHYPYHTRQEFIDNFRDDGYEPIRKPYRFAKYFDVYREYSPARLDEMRLFYDEFILYLDSEFNRLFTQLDESGVLDNTWIIFTSDHGEMFERSIYGHSSPTLYLPLMQIPLLIFAPGQKERQDIYTPTSAVDILPTLMHITGEQPPPWCEGEVLPPDRQSPIDSERSIFAFDAKSSPIHGPLSPYAAMIVKDQFKLGYYSGYEKMEGRKKYYDLYNFIKDPEELDDLSTSHRETAEELLAELLSAVSNAERSDM